MSPECEKDKNLPYEIVAEDFKSFNDSFWKNESSGETRVQFFIGLVTAVISGLVALATTIETKIEGKVVTTTWINEEKVFFIAIFALLSLFIIGWITFLRMVRRNCVTEEYKAALDYIRSHFATAKFECYEPFRKISEKKPTTGGLSAFVAVINGNIIALLVFLLCSKVMLCEWSFAHRSAVAGLVATVVAVIVVVLKISWANEKRKKYRKDYRNAMGLNRDQQ